MRNSLYTNKTNNNQLPDTNEALKATSLLYLDEALRKEEYEICADLINGARGFGAKDEEVAQVLADYIRGIGGAPQKVQKGRF